MKHVKDISTFRAFRNRNYALFFGGQSVSQIGTWMQRTGVSWLVYTMTHSPFMLGLTIFASQFPSFVFSLWGGVVSDRYSRYKIMLITQIASMVQAVLLTIMTFTDQATIAGLLTLSAILGIINAFDVPARQPLVHELISNKEDLPNALALNSSMVNLARLVGPALSGMVLQQFGASTCFLINAISFIAVFISLAMLKLPAFTPPVIKNSVSTELREGLTYLKNTPAIGTIIFMLTVMSLFVLPYDTLLPVFAKTVFNGGAATFGYISSFMGLGAIIATLFLASLKQGSDLKIILLVNTIILGFGLMSFSHVSYFPLAMVFAVLTGFGAMSQTAICITIIQVNSGAAMRGRVMSYIAMSVFGMLPLGSLLSGLISQYIGAPNTLLCQGMGAIVIAMLFSKFLRKDLLDKREQQQMKTVEDEVIERL